MSSPYFEVGDICFVIEQRYEYVPVFKCPMCNGTGMSLYLPKTPCDCVIHGLTTETYECRDGMMSARKRIFKPDKGIINGRSESLTDNMKNYDLRYCVKNKNYELIWYPSERVFSNLEDAQNACDELNSKIIYPNTAANESA